MPRRLGALPFVAVATLTACAHPPRRDVHVTQPVVAVAPPAAPPVAVDVVEPAPPAADAPRKNRPPARTPAVYPDEVRAPLAEDLAVYVRDVPGTGPLVAEIVTTLGTLTCELFEQDRPITVANFVGLAIGAKPWIDPRTNQVAKGVPYYDGLTFHRVIPGFMIQGGDPQGQGTGGPGYRFVDELGGGHSNKPGSLAMANSGPATNGSQFFINEGDNARLDASYTVFGQCAPFDLIMTIINVPTGPRDRPVTPVVMEQVTIKRGT